MINARKFIPLILALLLIFGLTFMNCDLSEKITQNTQRMFDSVYHSLFKNTDKESHWWNNFALMRKFAHSVEYFLLGFAACFMFKRSSAFCSIGICALTSFIDQTVKGFLPGREFDWSDMPFDFVGCVMGI